MEDTERLRRRFVIGGVGCMTSPVWGCFLLAIGLAAMVYIANTPQYSDWIWTFLGKTTTIAASSHRASARAVSPTGRYIVYQSYNDNDTVEVKLLNLETEGTWYLPQDVQQEFWLTDTILGGARYREDRALYLFNAATNEQVPLDVRMTVRDFHDPMDVVSIDKVRAEIQNARMVYRIPVVGNGLSIYYVIAEMPDGSFIGYPSSDERVIEAIVKDRPTTIIPYIASGKRVGNKYVSPNGQYFMYPPRNLLILSNANGVPLAVVMKPDAHFRFLGWADEGRSVIFSSNTGTLHYPVFKVSVVSPAVQLWYCTWPLACVVGIVWLYRRHRRQKRIAS